MENKLTRNFVIGTFVVLYVLVSIISTIHVIDFFKLSNPTWLAVTLALAFEVGAAASLASIIALRKMNKFIVWGLFFILTAMQAMGNTFYAYVNLENYQPWIELFGLIDEEPIFQKRMLAIVSGGILPLVALGFIKSLVDYIKPEANDEEEVEEIEEEVNKPVVNKKTEVVQKIRKENLEKYTEQHQMEDEPVGIEEDGVVKQGDENVSQEQLIAPILDDSTPIEELIFEHREVAAKEEPVTSEKKNQ